jgi:hydrogenase maturation factor
MRPGKLTAEHLSRLILPRRGTPRPDVLVHAGLGYDAAVVDFGAEAAVLSTDPITGAGENSGWLAVQIGCNDVAATGAEPVGVLLTLLLAPPTAEGDARRIMEDAHRAAEELRIEIIGGHSEITAGLPRSIVVATVLGRVPRGRYVTPAGARPGDTLFLTKWAGLEGTAVLAADFAAPLERRLGPEVVREARRLLERISIVPEALAARAHATAMHDATEGGVLGALAELAAASGHGVDVDLDRVPILPTTEHIARAFQIDPLALVSSGALLVTSPEPAALRSAVARTGQPIAEIGRVVAGPSHARKGSREIPLQPPARDALWDALERGVTSDE